MKRSLGGKKKSVHTIFERGERLAVIRRSKTLASISHRCQCLISCGPGLLIFGLGSSLAFDREPPKIAYQSGEMRQYSTYCVLRTRLVILRVTGSNARHPGSFSRRTSYFSNGPRRFLALGADYWHCDSTTTHTCVRAIMLCMLVSAYAIATQSTDRTSRRLSSLLCTPHTEHENCQIRNLPIPPQTNMSCGRQGAWP